MNNYLVKALKASLSNLSDDTINQIAGKIGIAKSVEEILAISEEYQIGLSEKNCKDIFDSINSMGKDIPIEDLDTVSGGCNTEGC